MDKKRKSQQQKYIKLKYIPYTLSEIKSSKRLIKLRILII